MDRINQFKKKRFMFGSVEARMIRACEIEKRRKEQRSQDITRNRLACLNDEDLSDALLSSTEAPTSDVQCSSRIVQLMKWKAEKELKKKIDAQNKKPPFVVGIPHHKPWSSTFKNTSAPHCQHHRSNKASPIASMKTTRATARKLREKNQLIESCKSSVSVAKTKLNTKKNKADNENISIFPSVTNFTFYPSEDIATVRMLNVKDFPTKKKLLSQVNNIVEKSFVFHKNKNENLEINHPNEGNNGENVNINQPSNNKLETLVDIKTAITGDKMSKSINDSVCENSENNSHQPLIPATFSPFIITKRGKSNARNEQRERLGLNSPQNHNIPTKDTIADLSSSGESPETAKYYKYLLSQETDRLLNLCKTWEEIQNHSDMTDDGRYIINQTIGQTKLLINKKFQRFQNLILDCEKGNKELLVTCRDLEGFWDMMSMEIKDCHSRFEKLEKLQMNHWIEEEYVSKVRKVRKKSMKKVKINGKSNVRAFIEAKKKQKKDEQNTESTLKDDIFLPKIVVSQLQITPDKKNQEKTPQVNFDDSISYVNSTQTPGKSILKKTEKTEKISNEFGKSIKVNFDDIVIHNDPLTDKAKNCKNILVSKIAKMSDLSINPRKKVIQSPIENDKVIPLSRVLRSHSQSNRNTLCRASNSSNKDTIYNYDSQISSLSFTLNKSIDEPDNKSTKENSFTFMPLNFSISTTPYQRRSTRKSIKSDVSEECTGCISLKSTPITEKARKLSTRKKTNNKKNKSYSDKDFISFDSPLRSSKKKNTFNK